jgi:anaerobic selenocysteine-containing dehydrogenase
MVTAPARSYLNSSFTETPTSVKREGRPKVMIHPDTAAGLGVADDDLVVLGNKRGQVKVHAHLFDGLQPDVVVVEGIWPNKAFVDGIGINALTGADSPPPNGGAAFHDTAIWLKTA